MKRMLFPLARSCLKMSFHPHQHLREEPGEGFVKQVCAYVQGHGTGHLQQLPLSVGKVLGEGGALVPHAHVAQHLLGPLFVLRLSPLEE